MTANRAQTGRASTSRVLSVPMDYDEARQIVKDWPPKDLVSAIKDALLYGNVRVVDGRYVPWMAEEARDA